jgi:GTP-binding protein
LQKAARKKPIALSAVSGMGVKDALFALVREISRARADDTERSRAPRAKWQP